MRSRVTGTDNRELKKKRISEAAQNAEISLRSTYENLQNAYLSGESAWLSGEAAMNTAKLNLVSAYESYIWQVAGVETGASAGASGGGGAPAGR